jgi:hypothetical protein
MTALPECIPARRFYFGNSCHNFFGCQVKKVDKKSHLSLIIYIRQASFITAIVTFLLTFVRETSLASKLVFCSHFHTFFGERKYAKNAWL